MIVVDILDLTPLKNTIDTLKKTMKGNEAAIILANIQACLDFAVKESFEIKEEEENEKY